MKTRLIENPVDKSKGFYLLFKFLSQNKWSQRSLISLDEFSPKSILHSRTSSPATFNHQKWRSPLEFSEIKRTEKCISQPQVVPASQFPPTLSSLLIIILAPNSYLMFPLLNSHYLAQSFGFSFKKLGVFSFGVHYPTTCSKCVSGNNIVFVLTAEMTDKWQDSSSTVLILLTLPGKCLVNVLLFARKI